jgi:hypothetical protein
MTDHPWLFEPLKHSSKLYFCQLMMAVFLKLSCKVLLAVLIVVIMAVILITVAVAMVTLTNQS